MNNNWRTNNVAVLGSGVMGTQIAAHLTNAGIRVDLFDSHAEGDDPNVTVNKSIANLKTLRPPPFVLLENAQLIKAANYRNDLELLRGCDLVIEVIAERIDWKIDLYKKITP